MPHENQSQNSNIMRRRSIINLPYQISRNTRALLLITSLNLIYECAFYIPKIKSLLTDSPSDTYLIAAFASNLACLAFIVLFSFKIALTAKDFLSKGTARDIKIIAIIFLVLYGLQFICLTTYRTNNLANPDIPVTSAFQSVMYCQVHVIISIFMLLIILSDVIKNAAKIKQENDLTI